MKAPALDIEEQLLSSLYFSRYYIHNHLIDMDGLD